MTSEDFTNQENAAAVSVVIYAMSLAERYAGLDDHRAATTALLYAALELRSIRESPYSQGQQTGQN